jgi:hypothetical protein
MVRRGGAVWRSTAGASSSYLRRERVAATRLIVTRLRVEGRDVVMEGWRQPATGGVHWLVHPAEGLVPTDAALRGETDRSLRELCSTLGV